MASSAARLLRTYAIQVSFLLCADGVIRGLPRGPAAHLGAVLPGDHPKSVMLDFVQPARPGRRLALVGRPLGCLEMRPVLG